MTFYDFAKHQKTVSKTTFWSFQKSEAKYLIKSVAYLYFWGPFRKNLQRYRKAIRFSSKSWRRFTTSQNIKKPLVKQRFGACKKLFKIPYKTCRLLIILGPFPAKGPQKYQKSIRFFTKSWWRFTTLQNTKKPLATQRFGASKKAEQNTL